MSSLLKGTLFSRDGDGTVTGKIRITLSVLGFLHGCGSALVSMRIRIQIQIQLLSQCGSGYREPDRDPDPDPRQTLKSQNFDFYMQNILKDDNKSKTILTKVLKPC
jgi:hypothetical protein